MNQKFIALILVLLMQFSGGPLTLASDNSKLLGQARSTESSGSQAVSSAHRACRVAYDDPMIAAATPQPIRVRQRMRSRLPRRLVKAQLFPSDPSKIWITGIRGLYKRAGLQNPSGARLWNADDPGPNGPMELIWATSNSPGFTGYMLVINGVTQTQNGCFGDSSGGGTQATLNTPCDGDLNIIQVQETTTTHIYYSDPVYLYHSCRSRDEYPTPKNSCQQQTGQFAGGPVDIVSGRLCYQYQDFALSGPFGLEFTRTYDSRSAIFENFGSGSCLVNIPTGECLTQDLSSGWWHSYSAFLLIESQGSQVMFFDETHHKVYFAAVGVGQTVKEPIEGDSLTESADGSTYTVKTWHGKKYQFHCCNPANYLAYLTSITDRIGNQQIITRDGQNRIDHVTDALGRQLLFSYDARNRITQVVSSPSGAKVTFGYGPVTGCTIDELCSATDNISPVAGTYHYQYSDDDVTEGTLVTDTAHDLTRVTDPNGNIHEQNTYQILKPFGYRAGLAYVQTQTKGGQNTLNFSYPSAPDNNSTVITDELNRTTTYTFDPYLRVLTSVSGPICKICNGNQSVTYTYDNFDRMLSTTDGDGPTHTITYGYADDTVATYTGGISYIINPVLHITSASQPLSSGTNRLTNYTWYPAGGLNQDLLNVTTIPSADTTGNSKKITDTYDSLGLGLLQSEAVSGYIHGNPETHTTSFTYDTAGRGRLTKISGPRVPPDVTQQTTFNYYSDSGSDCPVMNDLWCAGQLKNVVRQVNASKTLTTTFATDSGYNTYTVYGQPRSVNDPNNVFVDLDFDPTGSLTKRTVKDTSAIVTSLSYDPGHRLTALTAPNLNGVTYQYDASNNLTKLIRTNASNLQEEQLLYGYDVMSQMTSEQAQSCTSPAILCLTWSRKQQENFQPDSFGRLKEVDHPCLPTCDKILYGYDGAGNLQTVQDENHTSTNTTYGYDFANRLTSIVQKLGTGTITTSYGYDIQDNVNLATDPNLNQTTYATDDFGRLRSQNAPSTSGLTAYTYDYANNLLTKTDANTATTTYTYDATDRVLTSTSALNPLPSEMSTWTYDGTGVANGQGRLTSVTDPSGQNNYTYDRRGNIVTEAPHITSSAYSLTYGYDPNGNRNSITYPDGNVVTYTYDWADRQLTAKFGTTQIVNSATYAPYGPLTSLVLGNGTTNGTTQTTVYDLRYRPSDNKLVNTVTQTSIADYLYAEDPVGNITQIHDNLNNNYNRDFTYDDLNRLLRNDSGSSLWAHATNAYDSIGNLTSANIERLTFAYVQNGSSQNTPKLASVTASPNPLPTPVVYDAAGNETAVGSATYSYSTRNLLASGDALNYKYDWRRIRAQTTGTPGTRNSLYDFALNMISESSLTNSQMIHEYIGFAGRPVAQVETIAGVTSFYYNFTDHLGAPLMQTKPDASIYWQAEYEPYGKVFALRAGDQHQPIRLPGQIAEQFDTGKNGATGKSYNGFRWYRPQWGRYTQADPLGQLAGASTYAYALDTPIGAVDPLGWLTCPPLGSLGADLVAALVDFSQKRWNLNWPSGKGPGIKQLALLPEIAAMAHTGGPLDLKNNFGKVNLSGLENGLGLSGLQMYQAWDQLGNYAYGAYTLAAGVPERYALRFASQGVVEQGGKGDPGWSKSVLGLKRLEDPNGGVPPFGDNPADQALIMQGFDFFKAYNKNKNRVPCNC